jgi:UPF0755 protein
MLAAYVIYDQAIKTPINQPDFKLEVPNGVGVAWIGNKLEKKGIIPNRHILRLYMALNHSDATIKSGEYTLVDVNNMPELVDKLIQGKVIQYAITLIEGHTYKQFIEQLKSQNLLVDELENLSSEQVMSKLGKPDLHPEGQFAPNTYFYQKGDTDFDVLKQAFDRQQQLVEQAWQQRAQDLNLNSAYELLTLASIVEKETGVAAERGLIAGVFNHRLRIGMKLQTDPTVIYGMGDAFDGNIRRKDLRTDTPYNTYTRYGLPPSPIANPGYDALMAVANPVDTEYLYFVGKGDGSHQFSKNLRDHNNAVIKYQLGGKPKKFSSN